MQDELDAARTLVNILYGGAGNDTVNGLYVGVVPYSTTVNINMPGLTPSTWLTNAGKNQIRNRNLYPNIAPTATSVGGNWMGCIEARTPKASNSLTNAQYVSYGYINYAVNGGVTMDANDTPPTSNATRFTPYLYPSTMAHKYVFGLPLQRSSGASSTTALSTLLPSPNPPWGNTGVVRGDNDWTLTGGVPAGSGLRFGDNYAWGGDGNMGVGPNLGCPIPMLPLTASQTTVQNTISNMKYTFRGGTMINVGLAAAWWMLSPNWRGMWPGIPATLPQAYNSTLKIVVLMTDGQNQWYDWPTGVPGQPAVSPLNYAADADYTAYGRLAEGRAGTTVFANTVDLLNTKMLTMCSALKNNGVTIYTIIYTHGGAIGSGTQSTFQSCATDPGKYFFAATGSDLQTAFQNIGQSITNLRLRWPGKP